MFCPYCGKQLSDSAQFCGFCGKSLKKPAAAQPEPPKSSPAPTPKTAAQTPKSAPAEPKKPAAPAVDFRPQSGAAWSLDAPKQRGRFRIGPVVIIAVVVLVLALAALGVLVWRGTLDADQVPVIGPVVERLTDRSDKTSTRADRKTYDDEDEEEEEETDADEEPPATTEAPAETAAQTGSDTPAVLPAPETEPTPEPASATAAPEPEPRQSVWQSGSLAVAVLDGAGVWPESAAKPFAGAAERIGDWTDYTVLVVTTNSTNGASAEDYLADCRDACIRDGLLTGRQTDHCVQLLIDMGSREYYIELRGDARARYSCPDAEAVLLPYLKSGDFETGVCRMLQIPESTPVPTEIPEIQANEAYYILPNSDSAYITDADLAALTWEECTLARNEIYARHGRIFATPAIREYFERQSWYEGTIPGAAFDARQNEILNAYESQNIATIAAYEKRVYGGSRY